MSNNINKSGRKKGCVPWNKGLKVIQIAWNKGLKLPPFSEEWKKKIIKNLKPNYWKGKIRLKGEKSTGWKGGIIKQNGYIHIYKPKHPFANNSYVREHRLIAEKILNRYLTAEEIIHHINGIRNDNRPENLYLFLNINEHSRFHETDNKPFLISNLSLSKTY